MCLRKTLFWDIYTVPHYNQQYCFVRTEQLESYVGPTCSPRQENHSAWLGMVCGDLLAATKSPWCSLIMFWMWKRMYRRSTPCLEWRIIQDYSRNLWVLVWKGHDHHNRIVSFLIEVMACMRAGDVDALCSAFCSITSMNLKWKEHPL